MELMYLPQTLVQVSNPLIQLIQWLLLAKVGTRADKNMITLYL